MKFLPSKKPTIKKQFRQKLDKQTDFVGRKYCCLKSQKYDVGLYIQKMDFRVEELGFIVTLKESNTNKVIIRTNTTRIHIEELQDTMNFLQAQVNFFDGVKNTLISTSFLDNFVNVEIEKPKSDETDSLDNSRLDIEIVFLDKKENTSMSEQTTFTSITTLDNVRGFVASVNDFLAEARSHGYSEITYIF